MFRQTAGRSVCQAVFVSGIQLGSMTKFLITARELRVCWYGAPSLMRGHCHYIFLAGPRKLSHYRVKFSLDSCPHCTLSDSWLPIVISPPPQQDNPGVPQNSDFLFRRLQRPTGLQLRYWNPLQNEENFSVSSHYVGWWLFSLRVFIPYCGYVIRLLKKRACRVI
jgi:hypothetical protein